MFFNIEPILIQLQETQFFWLIIPIFFIGIVTDKYQEEFETSLGNAISNGTLILFTAFSWIDVILSRVGVLPNEFVFSQLLFAGLIIMYGVAIILSGFRKGIFAKTYGRIRVVTFMLIFFTLMIYSPFLYNFTSIISFVIIFPLYYLVVTKLISILPSPKAAQLK
ncbi:MAG: hypothetical protein ACLFPL_02005 [Candidatus Nanoarchaeia archaeon]